MGGVEGSRAGCGLVIVHLDLELDLDLRALVIRRLEQAEVLEEPLAHPLGVTLRHVVGAHGLIEEADPPHQVRLRDAVDGLQLEALLADGEDVEAAVRVASGAADGGRGADLCDGTAERADLVPGPE